MSWRFGLVPFLLLSLFTCGKLHALDYYWVGNGGDWSDFSNHWATTSGGGTFHTGAPSSTDNVFFDGNSFSVSGDTVYVDVATVTCQDMDWTGVSQDVFLDGGAFNDLEVYGNCTLNNALVWVFKGRLNFQNLGNSQFSPFNVSLGGSLSINGGGTVFLETDFDADTAIDVSFGILSAENLAATTSYNIEVGGGFQVFGNFISGTGKVSFDGDGMQMIMGGGPIGFYDLEINNTSPDPWMSIQGGGQVEVSNQLIFTNGLYTCFPGNELKLLAGASYSGANQDRYVAGPMTIVGNADVTFPIGGGGRYQPVSLANLTGPATDEFTIEYSPISFWDLNIINAPLNNVSSLEYFDIQRFGTSNADVTFAWASQDASSIDNAADLSVAHFNGTSWDKLGQSSITFAPTGDITINGVTNFSPFTFGSDSPVLNPLSLGDTLKVGDSEAFSTIQQAYDAIPFPVDKEYWILIESDYDDSNEILPVFFNVKNGGYRINIMPDLGVSGTETVGFSPGFQSPIFEFSGCSNVILDGRPGGVGSEDWLVRNTNTGVNAGSAIVFSNDADSNKVQYLDLEAEPDPSGNRPGIISFDFPFGAGYDYDSIIGCKIHDLTVGGSGVVPFAGIYAQGNGAVHNNSCLISGNEFYDCIGLTSGHTGAYALYLDAGNDAWRIVDNHFYQTSSIPNLTKNAGFVYIEDGSSHLISGNHFGGKAVNAGGSAFTIDAGSDAFSCIRLGLNLTGDSSVIVGNTISNFGITSSSTNALVPAFTGIFNEANAPVTIGTLAQGNVIGSMSLTDDITVTDNNGFTNKSFCGIYNFSTDNSYIVGNSIGGIRLEGSVTNSLSSGVTHDGTSEILVEGNTIGGTAANSLKVNSDILFAGIYNQSFSGQTFYVTNNRVQNLDHNATNWDAFGVLNDSDSLYCANNIFNNWDLSGDSSGTVIGHYDLASGAFIENNLIENITSSGTGNGAGFVGIDVETFIAATIMDNTIGGEGANNVSVSGNSEHFGILTVDLGAFTISGNTIQNIEASSSLSGNRFYGIYGEDGLYDVTNNEIVNNSYAGSASFESMNGIYIQSDAIGMNISDNVIQYNEMTSNSGPDFTGIFVSPSDLSDWSADIQGNLVANISAIAASSSGVIQGMYWTEGDADVYNNVVLLDNEGANNSLTLLGFYMDFPAGTGQNRVYHNTVSIEGTMSAGSSPSSAFRLDDNVDTEILNNIFKNIRNGGTGDHLIIEAVGGGSFNTDYNFFESPIAKPWSYSGSTRSFTQWKSSTGGDANAIHSTESLDSLGYATSGFGGADLGTDLYVGGAGEVTVDREGDVRDANPWMGAYEGIYVPPYNYPQERGSGYALSFNGSNKYISFGAPITMQQNDVTLEAWVKWDGSNTGAGQSIIVNGNTATSGQHLYVDNLSGELRANFGGVGNFGSGMFMTADRWQHVALVGTGTNNWTLYLDGEASVANGFTPNVPNTGFYIGGNQGGAEVFPGEIDEVRVWNKALSINEIRDYLCLNDLDAHPQFGTLVGQFSFDDGPGSSVLHDRGDNFVGTLNNFTVASDWITSGASLGDSLVYTYGGGSLLFTQDNRTITVNAFSGGVNGMFLYYVNDTANVSTVPAGFASIDSIGFFGVHKIGGASETYDVTIDYTADVTLNGQPNESKLRLLKRDGPSAAVWEPATGSIRTSTSANTIFLPNQTGTEYVVGYAVTDYPEEAGAGYALDFDDLDDYVSVVDGGALAFSGDMTAAMWIKMNALGEQETFVSYSDFGETLAENAQYSLGVRSGGNLWYIHEFGNGSNQLFDFTYTISPGKWIHLAITRDVSANQVLLYVNGIFQETYNYTTDPDGGATTYLAFGQEQGASNAGRFLNGQMDEVSIWDTVLSESEIREIVCQKLNASFPDQTNLMAYWRFDDGENSDTLFDLVGNNHGVLMGMDPNTDWVLSGAALGDTSVYSYGGTSLSASLDDTDNTDLEVADYSGVIDGVQIYFVRDTINASAIPPGMSSMDSVGYYGVFKIGDSLASYTATVAYTNNTSVNGQVNESNARVATRSDGSSGSVEQSSGQFRTNTALNTITLPNQIGTEYLIGFSTSAYPEVSGAGYSLDFDGLDDQVTILNDDALQIGGDLTLSGWVKMDAVSEREAIFSCTKDGETMPSNALYVLGVKPGGVIWYLHEYGAGANESHDFSYTIDPNVWTHLALTRDVGTNQVRLYVNGVFEENFNYTNDPAGGDSTFLRFGEEHGRTGADRFLDGQLDELAIWSEVRTETQIRDVMCQKLNLNFPVNTNLAGYWRFDDGPASDTLRDLAGGNHGLLTSMDANSDWMASGASLGDTSVYVYGGGPLTLNVDRSFTADNFSGGVSGLHVYYVDDTANVTTIPAGFASIDSIGFFGVHKIGGASETYDVTIDYTADVTLNGQPNESNLRLLKRDSPSAAVWEPATGTIRTNNASNTIFLPSQTGTEYVVGYVSSGYPEEPGSGYTLLMDGVNEFVDLASGPITTSQNNLTFETWFKWDGSNAASTKIIMVNGNTSSSGHGIFLTSANDIRGILGGTLNLSSGVTAEPNKWYHVAFVGDVANNWTIYVNGVNHNSGNALAAVPAGVFRIGASIAGTLPFPGEVDELRVWNMALSQATIRDYICNKSLTSHPNFGNLLAYYRFDDASGSTLVDLAGPNNMTLNNMEAGDWIYSGAYLGDSSVHNYTNTSDVILASPSGGTFTIKNLDGNADSLHLYYVADTANDLSVPAGADSLDKTTYWGIFGAGSSLPFFDLELDYAAHPGVNGHENELGTLLAGRPDNSLVVNWGFPSAPTVVTVDSNTNILNVDSVISGLELVVAYAPALGPNYYVNDGATGADVFTSSMGVDALGCGGPNNPCATIQYVVDNYVLDYDTIFVDAGQYAQQGIIISTADTVVLQGAGMGVTVFEGTSFGTIASTAFTIQSEEFWGNDFSIRNYNRTGAAGSDAGGIDITNSNIIAYLDSVSFDTLKVADQGGAIEANGDSLIVTNCQFRADSAIDDGGAIYAEFSSVYVSIEDCEFLNDFANGGGAAFIEAGNFRSRTNTYQSNEASTGGAVRFTGDTMWSDLDTLLGNVATSTSIAGGAIYSFGGTLYLDSTLFKNNYAQGNGGDGGALSMSSAIATVTHSVFDGDTCDGSGGAIYCSGTSVWNSSNSVFKNCTSGSTGGITYMNGTSMSFTSDSIYNNSAGSSGGAVYSFSAVDKIEATSCYVEGNTSNGSGGAFYLSNSDTLILSGNYVRNNSTTSSSGAAVYVNGAVLLQSTLDTFFLNNSASAAGAVFLTGTANSTFNGTIFGQAGLGNTGGNGGALYVASGGRLTANNCDFVGNTATTQGGALYAGCDWTSIDNCLFDQNQASQDGGAICMRLGADTAFITNTVISNNLTTAANTDGGGIYTDDVMLTMRNDSIYGNSCNGSGGGYYARGANQLHTIDNCYFGIDGNGNTAEEGGGMAVQSITMVIDSSSVTDNVATGGISGAGIYFVDEDTVTMTDCFIVGNRAINGAADGGGIRIINGDHLINIESTVIAENFAADDAGAILVSTSSGHSDISFTNCLITNDTCGDGGVIGVFQGRIDLINCTVADNHSTGGDASGVFASGTGDTIFVFNTILYGNSNGDIDDAISGVLWAKNSLIGAGAAGIDYIDSTNNVSGDPLFTNALGNDYTLSSAASIAADVGGATWMGLSAPAIDIVDTTRPRGNGFDLGAYESEFAVVFWNGPNYYVNDIFDGNDQFTTTSGSDIAGCGGPSNPCATVQFVMNNYALSYDTLFVDAGRYFEQAITVSTLDTAIIQGAGMGVTIFDGTIFGNTALSAFVIQSQEFWGYDFSVRNYDRTGTVGSDAGAMDILGTSEMAFLDSVSFDSNYVDDQGGAIQANGDTLQLEYCVFSMDSANDDGGAMYVEASCNHVVVNNSQVTTSGAVDGGGFYFEQANLESRNNIFDGNTASRGGGIFFLGDTLWSEKDTLRNNIGTGNSSSGGAIYIVTNVSYLDTTVFEDNYAQGSGGDGGALFVSNTDMFVDNCVFDGDTADGSSGVMHMSGTCTWLSTNSVYKNNRAGQFSAVSYTAQSTIIFDGDSLLNNSGVNGGVVYSASTSPHIEFANCHLEGNVASSSGGVIYMNGGDSLFLSNNYFINNQSTNTGGAVYFGSGSDYFESLGDTLLSNQCGFSGGAIYIAGGSEAIIRNAVMGQAGMGNTADDGGAIYLGSGLDSITIRSCQIVDNTVTDRGGGIFGAARNIVVDSCLIDDNEAVIGGGGLYLTGSPDTCSITNCVISNNISTGAGSDGGGIFMDDYLLTMTNDSVFGNSCLGNGGGMYALGSGSIHNISNCYFGIDGSGNIAAVGGGIYYSSVFSVMDSCYVTDNRATGNSGGAGILIGASDTLTFNNVDFVGNRATSAFADGGAIKISGSGNDLTFESCLVAENFAADDGGAIYLSSSTHSDLEFINCVVRNDTSGGSGGAAYIIAGRMDFVNSTIADNHSTGGTSGGLYVAGAGDSIFVFNSIVFGNTNEDLDENTGILWVKNSLIGVATDYVDSSNNIVGVAPLFNSAATGDYSILNAASPVVDAGGATWMGISAPALDIVDTTRPTGLGNDIGAYETQFSLWTGPSRYVNDGVTAGDIYTTAIGLDIPGCGGPNNPCSTVRYVLDNYNIIGDTVFIDAGTYGDTNIVVDADQPIFVGAGRQATVFDGSIVGGTISRAFLIDTGSVAFRDMRFENYNSRTGSPSSGGALRFQPHNSSDTVRVVNCTFDNNQAGSGASAGGGAILFYQANGPSMTVFVDSCTFTNNSSDDNGGALWFFQSGGSSVYAYLDGDTIGTTGNGNTADVGGGLASNVDTMSLNNCFVQGNSSDGGVQERGGGGLRIPNGYLTIDNTVIDNNTSARCGGGIALSSEKNVSITNSAITNNAANGTSLAQADGGGGFWTDSANVITITNCNIDNNTTQEHGGGLYLYQTGDVTVTNSTINGNDASAVNAGGVYVRTSADLTFVNDTLDGNTAANNAGAILMTQTVTYTPTLTLDNCILSNNSAVAEGGAIRAAGNSDLFIINGTRIGINGGGNTAQGGGGIFWEGDTLSFDGSFLEYNTSNAVAAGGGSRVDAGTALFNNTGVSNNASTNNDGAGLFLSGTTRAYITNCTLDSNIAIDEGGAIAVVGNVDLFIIGSALGSLGNGNKGIFGGAVDFEGDTLYVTNSSFAYNTASNDGGGIHFDGNDLILTNVDFTSDSSDTQGGAIYMTAGTASITDGDWNANVGANDAGALYVEGGAVTINGTSFNGNRANSGSGGAIHGGSANAVLNLRHTTFTNNLSTAQGGAIYTDGSVTLVIDSSAIGTTGNGNTSARGGGIDIEGDALTIDSVTFVANVASGGNGGGGLNIHGTSNAVANIYNTVFDGNSSTGGSDGGGLRSGALNLNVENSIFRNNSSADDGAAYHGVTASSVDTLINCLFYENVANDDGGAMYVNNGNTVVINSTIAQNASNSGGIGGVATAVNGDLTLINTIASFNDNHDVRQGSGTDGTINVSYSLVNSLSTDYTDGGNNLIGVDPLFSDTLNDNYLPLAYSTIIDAGNSSEAPALDIRDTIRPQAVTDDIGAFEIHNPCDPLVVTETDDDSTCGDIRFAIGWAENNALRDTITFDASLASGTITLTSTLPVLAGDSTVINGDFVGGDCIPDITFDGTDAAFDGIEISGNHNVIKGLHLINFAGSTSNAAVLINGGDTNTVICNYVGTSANGLAASGATSNDYGVYITGGSNGNMIGDSIGTDANVISGNTSDGIFIPNL